MRTYLRGKVTLLFMTCAVLLAIPAIALADDISNNLDASIDSTAEVMPLTVGDADGTTQLYVKPQNGDGKSGCNLSSGSLQLSVSSSAPSVATVSPSSVTFNTCDELKTLTVHPVAQGSATISVSQTSNTSAGTFNLAPATFTVDVSPPPNTAPTVTVDGVTAGASYNKGSVPDATCQVTDAEDGNSSFPATLSAVTGPYASDGIGSQTASCSYTDGGGLQASASETYSIVDPTPPVITRDVTGTLGNNGWYTSDVTVDWTVSDPESPNSLQAAGNITGCEDQNITADQTEQTYSCSATSAGGSSGPESVSIKRDATDPTDIAFVGGGLTNSASYYFGSVPAGPTSCTADGAISGLKSPNGCVLSGYGTAVGSHAVTATAEDNAGNIAERALSYTVLGWAMQGFTAPVDMNGVYNTVKGGSTVPFKFEVFAGPTELTDVGTTIGTPGTTGSSSDVKQAKVACTTGTPEDAIEATTTGSTILRYDSTGGQFVFNWQTPKAAGSCYKVTIPTKDGSSLTAYFKLK